MPWKSLQQERWGNSPAGIKAMGKAKVAEFNSASKGKRLPAKVNTSYHHHSKRYKIYK